jgi:hypothetical protein
MEAPVGVDAVYQHVAAGRKAVEREVLAFEVGGVGVAVADRDACAHLKQVRV